MVSFIRFDQVSCWFRNALPDHYNDRAWRNFNDFPHTPRTANPPGRSYNSFPRLAAEGGAENFSRYHSSLMTKNLCPSPACAKTCRVLCKPPFFPNRCGNLKFPAASPWPAAPAACPKSTSQTGRSTAEIYLHGAHVTGFPEKWRAAAAVHEPRQPCLPPASRFAAACRFVFRGSARARADRRTDSRASRSGNLVETSAAPDGTVTVRLRLPQRLRDARMVGVAHGICRHRRRPTDDGTDRHQRIGGQKLGDRKLPAHLFSRRRHRRRFPSPACKGAPFDDFAAGAAGARKTGKRFRAAHHEGNQPRLSRRDRHGGNPRRKSQADDPRGKIQFPFHRRLESVDDAEIAGRLRPGGTPATWSAWNPAT